MHLAGALQVKAAAPILEELALGWPVLPAPRGSATPGGILAQARRRGGEAVLCRSPVDATIGEYNRATGDHRARSE